MSSGARSGRRLAAILSADAVGYTRLMAQDEAATVRTIKDCRSLIAGAVGSHGGDVVDSPGDNVLALFPSALDALGCGIELQTALAERNRALAPERRMPFRLGIHLGDVLSDEDRVYGEGVNLAARLEALADPGGICTSANVHDLVRGKLDCRFEDLGERVLKNVPEPVRVYRVVLEAGPVAGPGAGSELAERPAIAVLPFANLSSDPDAEGFADAIASDLITLLSAWRAFPVIARNSSFTYKGEAVESKRVSRELGARYLVEGTVRAAAGRVRVSAQLVEGASGHQLWAQKYDRPLSELFDVQDEVTEAIVAALQPEVRAAEAERARRAPPGSVAAWAIVNRAWTELQADITNREARTRARAEVDRALELDPDYPLAHGLRALARSLEFNSTDPNPSQTVAAEVLEEAERALALAPDDPQLLQIHGATMGNLGRTDDALRSASRALELDPGNAQARAAYGIALIFKGQLEECLENVDQALRLSPRDPLLYNWLGFRSLACLLLGRCEEAARDAEDALRRRETRVGWMVRATALGRLGRLPEAREAYAGYERFGAGTRLAHLEPFLRALGRSEEELEGLLADMSRVGFE